MNKIELIAEIANKLDISKAEAERNINDIIGTIMESAKAEGECTIPGLGKLKVENKPASTGESFGKAWSKPAYDKFKLIVGTAGDKFLAQ